MIDFISTFLVSVGITLVQIAVFAIFGIAGLDIIGINFRGENGLLEGDRFYRFMGWAMITAAAGCVLICLHFFLESSEVGVIFSLIMVTVFLFGARMHFHQMESYETNTQYFERMRTGQLDDSDDWEPKETEPQ